MGKRIKNPTYHKNDGVATRSIHAGMQTDKETRVVKRPLVMSNNYEIPTIEDYEFFRVSVGLENPENLMADLDQAREIVRVD
jgi:cystathionine beta-lyase/cystathionine gamma-synthase